MLFWYSKSNFWHSILTFELSRKMLFWYSKSYFDIRTESENALLIFEILFWHSENSILTCSFDIQDPILTFEPSRKIVFWPWKCYFDIRTESENRILTFEILFWHSIWVGKSYFDIQNPICHSNWVGKSYFYIQNPMLTFELNRKILFWYSKSYFVLRTESENAILIFKTLF